MTESIQTLTAFTDDFVILDNLDPPPKCTWAESVSTVHSLSATVLGTDGESEPSDKLSNMYVLSLGVYESESLEKMDGLITLQQALLSNYGMSFDNLSSVGSIFR